MEVKGTVIMTQSNKNNNKSKKLIPLMSPHHLHLCKFKTLQILKN